MLVGVVAIFVCDMHSDSLTFSEREPLMRRYNHPKREPWLIFFAHFVPKRNLSPQIRREKLMNMHKRYLSLIEKEGITPILGIDDIGCSDAHSLFSIEGGGGLFADSPELTSLYASGLRVLGMAWDKNELCASSNEVGADDYGLTRKGRELAKKCSELGIILDTSHMSDRAFFGLVGTVETPIVATHSNFRGVCQSNRNLTDDMALIIKERGGLVGLNLYPPHLLCGGAASVYDIQRHIDYGLSLLGEDSIALGLDIDGTGGKYPRGISTAHSIHDKLLNLLLSEYPERTVRKIAGENVLGFLSRAL